MGDRGVSGEDAFRRRGAGVEPADSFLRPLHSPRAGTAEAGAPALFSSPSPLSAAPLNSDP